MCSILTVISTFDNAVNVINEVLPNLENTSVSEAEDEDDGDETVSNVTRFFFLNRAAIAVRIARAKRDRRTMAPATEMNLSSRRRQNRRMTRPTRPAVMRRSTTSTFGCWCTRARPDVSSERVAAR